MAERRKQPGGGNSHQRAILAKRRSSESASPKEESPAPEVAAVSREYSVGERIWRLVYDDLFQAGIASALVVAVSRAVSAEHTIVSVTRYVAVLTWLLFAGAIRKTNFFEKLIPNVRALGDAVLSLSVGFLLLAGWFYGPWEKAPKIYITGGYHSMSPSTFPQIGIEVENMSEDDAFSVNMDARTRMVPYNGSLTSPQDYFAMDDKITPELLTELESSTILRDRPFKGGMSAHAKNVFSLLGDRLLTEDDVRKHAEGKLILAAVGRIVYTDSQGCSYHTDFCGFFGKTDWFFAHCRSGHFEQAIRTNAKCQLP
jgi:hypothetical protein